VAIVAARTALTGSSARHKVPQPLELIVTQRIDVPNHQGGSPKISLESRKTAGENPQNPISSRR
jgi:hypothetical protein